MLVVAAILNFIVMTIRRADSSYPSRGFWAALLIWILIFSVAHYISTADERRAAAAAQRTEAIKLAADGDDLQAFQTAVKNCRLHCDRYYTLEVLYNQLAIRGKTNFVKALQSVGMTAQPAKDGEQVETRTVRFRTVGDITCTCPVESPAASAAEIVIETLAAEVSERGATRMDDKTSEASMEKRKKDGYF